jgi:hypothetical protein
MPTQDVESLVPIAAAVVVVPLLCGYGAVLVILYRRRMPSLTLLVISLLVQTVIAVVYIAGAMTMKFEQVKSENHVLLFYLAMTFLHVSGWVFILVAVYTTVWSLRERLRWAVLTSVPVDGLHSWSPGSQGSQQIRE